MPRFVHFMSVDSPIFNSVFIQLVNEEMNGEEHLFLIGGEGTYVTLSKQYKNVVFELDYRLATIRKYDTGHEILVLHSMFLTSAEFCHLKKEQLKRLVWCVWGHDLYRMPNNGTLKERFYNWMANRKNSNIRAIVAGFKYDTYEIRRRFGNSVPVYHALYSSGYYKHDIDRIIESCKHVDGCTRIMIGHSAFPYLQHEKLFRQLERYKDENILITLVLSYGDETYAARIIKTASSIFGMEKLNIIRNFMNWDEYIQLLGNIDIAIFDFEHQAAFGNLILLSYLKKKIYLSPNGIMYQAFMAEGAEVYSCSDIGKVPFEELKDRNQVNVNSLYAESLLNKENIITQWKQLFQVVR